MARYLSPEWFEDVNAAARERPSAHAAHAAHLTLQQVVTGGPDGDVRYWVRLHDGRVETGLGDAQLPDATISQSYDTAVAVVTGELSVQAALMSGEIRLSGDMATLVEHQEALRGLDAAFSAVRRGTSFR
ncbi:MAG: SCP2 sterol-binding domain-containing protein [Actinomycetota bacterium]|nr:SCP2 sterol-binding domain-containing protein [Actinomycetota bacterium]MDQ3680216.1 SCP2 sterol-binding domain-containing protein [Actinomycetota bacterium]